MLECKLSKTATFSLRRASNVPSSEKNSPLTSIPSTTSSTLKPFFAGTITALLSIHHNQPSHDYDQLTLFFRVLPLKSVSLIRTFAKASVFEIHLQSPENYTPSQKIRSPLMPLMHLTSLTLVPLQQSTNRKGLRPHVPFPPTSAISSTAIYFTDPRHQSRDFDTRYSSSIRPHGSSSYMAYCADIGFVPKELRTDFDTKLMGHQMQAFMIHHNSVISSVPAGKQRSNGICERSWRSLLRMSRSWLVSRLLPTKF